MTSLMPKPLNSSHGAIAGLIFFDIPVHSDSRGWFKENWQREKMTALGLPDFGPVQNNISFNATAGTTRGIHAEPWDKYISVATGSIFGAWVDLRPGEGFGRVFTAKIDAGKAVFVPRGVGNAFQTLEDNTAYTYLVNAHWSAELKSNYTFVNLADPDLAIEWPIPLDQCVLSEADQNHPLLKDVVPMAPKRVLVTGCNGQLGRAVRALSKTRADKDCFDFVDSKEFNISDPEAYQQVNWPLYDTVINCAAYTAVDKAETPEGRVECWKTNATGPALLAKTCNEHRITLVHISSDYVFDGNKEIYTEDDPVAPLGVYGQSKAAGDLAVSTCRKHYIARTSWVIGDGNNFVRTMVNLSNRVADPADDLNQVTVVDDQFGRLSFTDEIAKAIIHLLDTNAPYGIYNVTGTGPTASWAEVAKQAFEITKGNADQVVPVTTEEYWDNKTSPVAARPANSTLDLSKLQTTGYQIKKWDDSLRDYLTKIAEIEI